MGRRRGLSEEDRKLWRAVTKDVAPLNPARVAAEKSSVDAPVAEIAPVPTRKKRVRAAAPTPEQPVSRPVPTAPQLQTKPLNRQWALALRRGTVAVEASLDLHGLTEDAAHRALLRFIASARAARLRTVLVVTGKGRQGRGVLKARLPQWLSESGLRSEVLALYPAHVRDGGSGAWYVVLRRNREERGLS